MDPTEIRDVQTLDAETPYTKLTKLQRHYVLARMQGLQPSHAARAIGIKTDHYKRAARFEKNPKVRAAFRWLAEQDRPELTREAVLDGFMDAVRSAGSSAELTMAWREISKILGYYAPEEINVNHKDVTTERLKSMSDRDILKFVGKGRLNDTVEEVYDAEYEVLSTAITDPEPVENDDAS